MSRSGSRRSSEETGLSDKSPVDDLDVPIEKLRRVNERVRKVSEEMPEKHVEWQEQAKIFNTQADELLSKVKPSSTSSRGLHFANPLSRFKRKETAHLSNVNELIVSGEKLLDSIIDVTEHVNTYHKFGSREEAYRKLWDALVKEDGHPIIGIYGMPGVGKTLMMEQACKQAEEEEIFDKVMIAHVGREVDVLNIQDQLAGYLNCHLESKNNELDRASQLYNSLNKLAKTLVVLDDIWGVIPFEKIGIPFHVDSPKGSKILFTSRNKDVWLDYNSDQIEIEKLKDKEAMELFKNTVSTLKINALPTDLVETMCTRCEGLPLLIRVVGRALMRVSEDLWKDALDQIEYGRYGWIDGIEPQVYACLKMSFDKLVADSKTCLFLCSLFPENADIEIKMLFDFATGSQLLDNKGDIPLYIEGLKSSYLLLPGKDEYTIRMPGIIRDVARSVATRDPRYEFSYIRCKSWLPDNVDYSTRRLLHLDLQGDYVGFPNDMVCPDLSILWLQCNNHSQRLSGGLFNNIRFMLIKGMVFSENQWPNGSMKELRILILGSCNLHITFLCFIPHNLETLRIRESDFPDPDHNDIRPLEVFSNLSIVEISRCTGSKFLFPVAVSKSLVQMRELRIDGCYLMEEIVRAGGSTEGEIICFPKLELLLLDDLPRLAHFYNDSIVTSSNSFFSEKVAFPSLKKLIIKKIGKATLFTFNAFRNLKKLQKLDVSNCFSMEVLVEDEVDGESPHGRQKISSVRLEEVALHSLPRLKCFSHNPTHAFNMPALKKVSLYGCPSMYEFTSVKIEAPPVEVFDGHVTKNISDLNSFVSQQVYQKEYSARKNKSQADENIGATKSNSKREDDNNVKDSAGEGESSAGKTISTSQEEEEVSSSYNQELVIEAKGDEEGQ